MQQHVMRHSMPQLCKRKCLCAEHVGPERVLATQSTVTFLCCTVLTQLPPPTSTQHPYTPGKCMPQVVSGPVLTVVPERGHVPAGGSLELEVSLLLHGPGPLSVALELEVRGGRVLKLPIRWVTVQQRAHAAWGAAHAASRSHLSILGWAQV